MFIKILFKLITILNVKKINVSGMTCVPDLAHAGLIEIKKSKEKKVYLYKRN